MDFGGIITAPLAGQLSDGLGLLQAARHELLLFAAFWFIVGALDEIAVDLAWLWLRLTGQGRTERLPRRCEGQPLSGRAAVIVPAWREAEVIGAMVRHTLDTWPQWQLSLYVGCYRNDPATLAAVVAAARDDPRLRIVIHENLGPTTKADCLNRLYRALAEDEARSGVAFAMVVIQDAEDMVHPAGLPAMDRAMKRADFVQLPVRPEIHPGSRWISAHYADEFAESHAKAMVVRDRLGAALPAAGVGCAFARSVLARLEAQRRSEGLTGPFASDCLTEDYELGLLIARMGGKGRFLRLRDSEGQLVATRSYFPGGLEEAVRQKTRWVHGIALQGWDRLGWGGRLVDIWMALRDRRGPLTALVLFVAYLLVLVEGVVALGAVAGFMPYPSLSPELAVMLRLTLLALAWRMAFRFACTAREYGWAEGLRAMVRMPVANVIAILSGRRAILAYLATLRGEALVWDKTAHRLHPAQFAPDRPIAR